jgi:tetratricopeptide (TPR) repeat protein
MTPMRSLWQAMRKGYLARDFGAGLFAIDRGIRLNANSARGFTFSGWIRSYKGDHPVAEEHLKRALKLSPLDPFAFRTRAGLAFALLFQGRFGEAVEEAQLAVRQNPNFSPAYRALAMAYAHSGRLDEARSAVQSLIRIAPDMTVEHALAICRFSRPEDREVFGSGLRLGGLPS